MSLQVLLQMIVLKKMEQSQYIESQKLIQKNFFSYVHKSSIRQVSYLKA